MATKTIKDMGIWFGIICTLAGAAVGFGKLSASISSNTQAIQKNTESIQNNARAIQLLEIKRAACESDFAHMEKQIQEMHEDVKILLQRTP